MAESRPTVSLHPGDRGRVEPTRYRLVFEGELGSRYSTAFEGMQMKAEGEETVVVGTIEDQAQLHGLLDRIASLEIKVVTIAPAGDEETSAVVGPPG